MNNIKPILLKEYDTHPHLELVDFVKLIFQHVNGGNHLLKDMAKAKQYLLNEYEEVTSNNDAPLYEDIGNEILRINLSSFKYQGLDIVKLFDVFVLSSKEYSKDVFKMEECFEMLKELIKEKSLPFEEKEIEDYLSWYRENDYPLVSHSETYRKYYNPHYRIIKASFLKDLFK